MARASRYLSYLAVEVEPGTDQKVAAFEKKLESAFDRVSAFNDRGSDRLGTSLPRALDQRVRTTADQTATSMRRVATETDRAKVSLGRAAAESNAMSTSLFRTAQALNVVQGPLGPLAGRLSSLGYIFRDLAGISLAGVLGGAGAFAIGQVASSYQQAYDRLRPFYDTQVQTNQAMTQVIAIARDTRQALDPIAQLYGRIGSAAKDAKVKVDQAALTETVAKAARLSGGDADTQQAGITQFIQGFGSGTLGGEELKSIRENTFRLAKALADGLGVPIAKLKELGAAGKLTPQVIAEALKRSADQIDVEFSRLALRPGQAITQATTNLSVFLGRLDQATGATVGFAKGIAAIGNNLDVTLSALAAFGATFLTRGLTAPMTAATVALGGWLQKQKQISQARRGAPVDIPQLAEVREARAGVDAAVVNQRAADAAVRAERAGLFAIEQRLAKAREVLTTATAQQRVEEQGAREAIVMAQARVSMAEQEVLLAQQASAARRAGDIEAARARLNAAREELRQARSSQGGAQQRFNAATRQVEAAATGPGSRADRARAASVAARAQAVAEAELAAEQRKVAAATAQVEAAEKRLTATRAAANVPTAELVAVTERLTAAEIALQQVKARGATTTSAVNQQAARGMAFLSEAEAVARDRARAQESSAKADDQARAAADRLSGAMENATLKQKAFEQATKFTTRSKELLTKAASGLMGVLGGPFGAALTVATAGITYLATRTDYAAEAAERYKTAQQRLATELGITTQAMARQSEEARLLALNVAKANLEQARGTRQSTRESLAGTLEVIGNRVLARGGGDESSRLYSAAANLRAGKDSGLSYKDLQKIRDQFPEAMKLGNGVTGTIRRGFFGALGANPENLDTYVKGLAQTGTELLEAQKAVRDAQAGLRAPKLPPIDLNGPKRMTQDELKAQAGLLSTGGTAAVRARNEYDATVSKLDAEWKKRRDANDFSFDQEYVRQLAAAESKLNAVGDAERAATAARVAGRRATAEATAATNDRLRREEALAKVLQRYSGEESAYNAGQNAQRQVESLFRRVEKGGKISEIPTITIDGEAITKAEALRRIVEGMNKPYNDMVRDQQQSLEIARLRLMGEGNAADLLQQQLDLEKQMGISRERGESLSQQQVTTLQRQYAEQQRINDAMAQRNRMIDIQVQGYRDMQDAVTSIARAAPDIAGGLVKGTAALAGSLIGGRGIGTSLRRAGEAAGPGLSSVKDAVQSVVGSFRDMVAKQWSERMFGDAEQKARDKMTRALETGSTFLQTAGTRLSTSAEQLSSAADALVNAASPSSATEPAAMQAAQKALLNGALDFDAERLNNSIGVLLGTEAPMIPDIIAAGKRLPQREPPKKPKDDDVDKSPEERFNDMGREFGQKLFGANSPFTRASEKLGTFLSGAQYGEVGVGVSQLFGSKGSSIGAAIGGGLGKTLLGGTGGLMEKGLTAISSKLGSFAGPLGSIAGSVLGSVVGGLFGKKAEQSNATISSGSINATGSSASLKKVAGGLGDSVTGGLDRIASALGGSVGGYNVSIGTYDGDYRVSTSGQTGELSFGKKNSSKSTLYDFGDDQAAAIQFAILDALKDGAIKGIREGARRLLQQGKDLDTAIQNAVDFQNVFRELKQYEDPVGAAIDDLNMEFERLIDLFNQAGASAAEFADLQKLYDLKRADAIKQATDASVDSLNDFITGLKAGSESPLSRREVYNNARSDVDKFRADLAAGKTVDSDKLLDALSNLQDASGTLNGSRGEFYSDFADILALAERAKANIEGTKSVTPNLPASPFADPTTSKAVQSTAASVAQSADTLSQILKEMRSTGSGGGAVNGSSLSYLPSKIGREYL